MAVLFFNNLEEVSSKEFISWTDVAIHWKDWWVVIVSIINVVRVLSDLAQALTTATQLLKFLYNSLVVSQTLRL